MDGSASEKADYRKSKLVPSYSCPDILDLEDSFPIGCDSSVSRSRSPSLTPGSTPTCSSCPSPVSVVSAGKESVFDFDRDSSLPPSSAHRFSGRTESSLKGKSSVLKNPFLGSHLSLSRSKAFGGSLQRFFTRGDNGRKGSLQTVVLTKYAPSPLSLSYKSRSLDRSGNKRGNRSLGAANATGPSPVCIVTDRRGGQTVRQVEQTDGGLLVPLGLQQYLGGSVDKVREGGRDATCNRLYKGCGHVSCVYVHPQYIRTCVVEGILLCCQFCIVCIVLA